MPRVYLDHNATTPLDPAALEEMLPWLGARFGNPSSLHGFGQEARRAIDQARARVARLVGARPDEIIFTASGTEADNLAVLGAVAGAPPTRRHVVTTAIEHQAVGNPCRHLEETGARVTLLGVSRDGVFSIDEAVASLGPDTAVASVMLANSDTGVLQPVSALAPQARALGVMVHTDAVQAVGKVPVDVRALGVDMLSFSGHKIHGPQGVGALFVRKGTKLSALLFGGHQERGLRPGTENVAAIVGFGKACDLAAARLADEPARLEAMRSAFEGAVIARVPGVTVHGGGAARLPNTSNLGFDGVDAEMLALNLDLLGVAASMGSACSSSDREPSRVLLAMGCTAAEARSSLRFSFGRTNTDEDVERAVGALEQSVAALRAGGGR